MRTIAFTRPEERLQESIRIVEAKGMTALCAPSLVIKDGDQEGFRKFLSGLDSDIYKVVVFTSMTAVEKVWSMASDFDSLEDGLRKVRCISIGRATRDRLAENGIVSDMPSDYTSEGLVSLLGNEVGGQRVALLRSDKGSKVLNRGLEQAGAEIDEFHVYHLEPCAFSDRHARLFKDLDASRVDAMALTSALSASTFIHQGESYLGKDGLMTALSTILVAAIGEPTSMEMISRGYNVDHVASKADFQMMIDEIVGLLEKRQ